MLVYHGCIDKYKADCVYEVISFVYSYVNTILETHDDVNQWFPTFFTSDPLKLFPLFYLNTQEEVKLIN